VTVQAVCEWNNVNGPSWIPMLIAVYSLGAYASGRPRTITACAVALIVGFLVVSGLLDDVIELPEVIGAAASLAVPFVIGDNVRRRRNELSELAERADRAERERELLAGQRVGEERTRIARDLHDVVAHSVSAMVIQAAAARRNVDRAPGGAVELLTNIEETGRRTMSELRQILGVLRDSDAGSSASPVQTIVDIGSLVDSATDLDVTLSTAGAIDSVPSGVATSAFRVVQEALTNARRHAGPNATIDVRVERTDDRLDVLIEDDGRGASAGQQPGYGLIGMGERVAAFGGTMRSGPRRAGGWQVRASFPIPA
jgi:signal transduction histidine kinase